MVGGHAFQEPFSPLSLLKPPARVSCKHTHTHTHTTKTHTRTFLALEPAEAPGERQRGLLVFAHVKRRLSCR